MSWDEVRQIRDLLEFTWRMEGTEALHQSLKDLRSGASVPFEVSILTEVKSRSGHVYGTYWEDSGGGVINQIIPCDYCGEHRADILLRPETDGPDFEVVCTLCHRERIERRWPKHREAQKARWQEQYQ